MNKPLIGIPCRRDKSLKYPNSSATNAQGETYIAAIAQAGGIPFLIPLNLEDADLRVLYNLCHGILLTGGGDIDPKLLDQADHPTLSDVQSERDRVEITLSRWAIAEKKPLLGICRGIQVLAVSGGGTLYQDLPSQLPEAMLHNYGYLQETSPSWLDLPHEVHLTPASRMAQILQTTSLMVNSLHHQAVREVAPPFAISGRSNDGVVEAIEFSDHPFCCAVQWHPEALTEKHETARRLFESFVETCQTYANRGM